MRLSELPRTLLPALRCPCCGSGFAVSLDLSGTAEGLGDGLLACDCYEYPVVQGIAVLRQISPVASMRNIAVEHLRAGDVEGALHWLLDMGSAQGVLDPVLVARRFDSFPFVRRLRRLVGGDAPAGMARITRLESFAQVLYASRPAGYADYLYHRFANPSLLGAIAPLLVLGEACRRSPRARLLDILCGTGHSSSTVAALCPGVDVIMADFDFVNLYIARRFLVPSATALCVDAELPLPFTDGSVDAVFCMDGLHYVRSKMALLGEVDRVVSADGAWLFAHMHNAACENVNPGTPLNAPGYRKRFAFGEQRLIAEAEIIRQFGVDGALDLSTQAGEEALSGAPALTLFGARDGRLWECHAGLDLAVLAQLRRLAFNPLYRVERADGGLVGTAAWPSLSLRRECSGTSQTFPDVVRVDAQTLAQLATAQAGTPPFERLRALVRSFTLVSLPECYPRSSLLPDKGRHHGMNNPHPRRGVP